MDGVESHNWSTSKSSTKIMAKEVVLTGVLKLASITVYIVK